MTKYIVIAGETGSGKTTIINSIIERMKDTIIEKETIYTTRKPREGEFSSDNYKFIDIETACDIINHHFVVSNNTYHMLTKDGKEEVKYITIDKGNLIPVINQENKFYIVGGSLELMLDYIKYYGVKSIIPIFLDAPFEVRFDRVINRKNDSSEFLPEICRRLASDVEDRIKFEKKNHTLMEQIHIVDNSANDDSALNTIIEIINRCM